MSAFSFKEFASDCANATHRAIRGECDPPEAVLNWLVNDYLRLPEFCLEFDLGRFPYYERGEVKFQHNGSVPVLYMIAAWSGDVALLSRSYTRTIL